MKSKEIKNKIIYWTLCTILIIFLFLLIGGVAVLTSESGFSVVSFVALLFCIMGSIIVMLSLYRPIALFGLVKPPSQIKDESILKSIQFVHIAYGFSFIIGGICYLLYHSIYVLLIFMLLPVVIIQVLNSKRKQ